MTGREIVPIQFSGSSETKRYVAPPSVPARLVGMRVSVNAAQSGTATVDAQKKSASHATFTIDLSSMAANVMHNASHHSSATSAEKMQEFDNSTPVEVVTNMNSSADGVVYLEFDPFMIGQGQDSLYA